MPVQGVFLLSEEGLCKHMVHSFETDCSKSLKIRNGWKLLTKQPKGNLAAIWLPRDHDKLSEQ